MCAAVNRQVSQWKVIMSVLTLCSNEVVTIPLKLLSMNNKNILLSLYKYIHNELYICWQEEVRLIRPLVPALQKY